MSNNNEKPNVYFRTSLRNTVLDVMSNQEGWVETTSEIDWDINWADIGWIRDNFDKLQFEDHQKLNHFPNHYELTRKDLLVKNLKRMKKQLKRSDSITEANKFDFWCTTFVLPAEYSLFLEEFKRHPGATWIMKPVGKAQGKGIFLFDKLNQISDWKKDHTYKKDQPQAENYVVQRYVENPYVIGGRKFDLRLYVLVTGFSPLVIWLYRDGFARFSGSRYSFDKGEIDNLEMHLTNASIQKKAEDYDKSIGCKWPLLDLKMYLISKHGARAVDALFYNIQCLVIRSLLAVQQTIIQDKHCFELYGYDILIDQELKPWLIEVNASPALTGDQQDYQLKQNLVQDVIDVIDLEGKCSGQERQIGGFDLIWDNHQMPESTASRPSGYSSNLGCTFTSSNKIQHPTHRKSKTKRQSQHSARRV